MSSELENLGFQPTLVRTFLKNDQRIPIHMIVLKMTETAKDIYSLSDLFYVKIKIEPYKSSGPAQCFNCQDFGHSSHHCKKSTPNLKLLHKLCIAPLSTLSQKCHRNIFTSYCTKKKSTNVKYVVLRWQCKKNPLQPDQRSPQQQFWA